MREGPDGTYFVQISTPGGPILVASRDAEALCAKLRKLYSPGPFTVGDLSKRWGCSKLKVRGRMRHGLKWRWEEVGGKRERVVDYGSLREYEAWLRLIAEAKEVDRKMGRGPFFYGALFATCFLVSAIGVAMAALASNPETLDAVLSLFG